jgi:hypothetical protein
MGPRKPLPLRTFARKNNGASMNWIAAVLRMAFVTLAMLLLSSDPL